MDKIPENFRTHIFKVQNCELNLSKNQSQIEKNWYHIHLKINVLLVFIIQGHILFIFSWEMLLFFLYKI